MIKKAIFLFAGTVLGSYVFAHEPINLAITKKNLKTYHDSGQYIQEIAAVTQNAMRYLDLRLERKDFHGKPAIILDIDETALSNYADMVNLDFGGTIEAMRQHADKGNDAPIRPTLKLFRYAKSKNIPIFFLTGRFEEERAITEKNLHKAGFTGYQALFLRTPQYKKTPATAYKTAIRKQLALNGYNILINMGDQQSDLKGGYADKTFKLPNPYYFIP